MSRCIGLEQLVPLLFLLRAFGFAIPIGIHIRRHMERLVRPVDGSACQRDFVRAQWFAVGFGGVYAVRAALADMGFASDEGGLVGAVFGCRDGF